MVASYYSSPIGLMKISASDEAITSVMFVSEEEKTCDSTVLLQDCARQLQEYFLGKRKQFDLPLEQHGTVFQQAVWSELLQIPFGETVSYLHIAKRLGKEEFVRAVGAANGQNKIALLVPCHRVIGTNGKLTGFAYGIERKQFLLDHEKAYQQMGLGI